MLRFLDRFYRDRRLLLAMPVIALLISIGFVMRQPRAYEATARVWVDASIQGDHPNPYITPADGGNLMLGETLRTRAFCAGVGSRSHLIPGPRPTHGPGAQAYEDLAYQALSTRVVLGTAGPNVITVTFRHENPTLAASTTQAVVDRFREEAVSRQAGHARETLNFYQKQVKTAQQELSSADARISDYLGTDLDQSLLNSYVGAGPPAAQPVSSTDVTLTALQRDDETLRKRTDELTQKLNQAQLDLTVAQQSTPNSLRLIDAPLAPQRPVSRTLPLLAAGLGGLAAGGLLSLLVLTALTAADSSLRYAAEVEPALGLRLVGTVPRVS
jgi:uncharacterized protein involved in exopolysaccharide biosynthesis